MKLKLLMGILLSAGIASSSYASNSQTNEEFFGDEGTTIIASLTYEDNQSIKVRIKGGSRQISSA